MEKITKREELKTYFESGDRPTEGQFSELIDSYVHLNELNFGFTLRPSSDVFYQYYDFYSSKEVPNTAVGHITRPSKEGITPEHIDGYDHVLGRNIGFKKMQISLDERIAERIGEYEPKIIIKRYKQKKRLRKGTYRKQGFIQEKFLDSQHWNRKSEYIIKDKETILDLEPIYYFRPGREGFRDFMPSGSLYKFGTFKFSRHGKPFVPLMIQLEIMINGIPYRSYPVRVKMVLGSSGITDVINYIVD